VSDAGRLFDEHQPGVFRYLCRFVGQADAARDLTQEVFLRVSRSAIPAAEAQRAWVYAIARNLALNHVRDRGRRAETSEGLERQQPATQETRVLLRQGLAALEDVDRDIFLLRESVGLSYSEIADTCHLTVEAVRGRLHRTRLALRAALTAPVQAWHEARGIRWNVDGRGRDGSEHTDGQRKPR
jgi:RNA polymerase sigma-70 factor (ECF subfamily)